MPSDDRRTLAPVVPFLERAPGRIRTCEPPSRRPVLRHPRPVGKYRRDNKLRSLARQLATSLGGLLGVFARASLRSGCRGTDLAHPAGGDVQAQAARLPRGAEPICGADCPKRELRFGRYMGWLPGVMLDGAKHMCGEAAAAVLKRFFASLRMTAERAGPRLRLGTCL